MQPYQKAAEALRQGEEYPLQILKQAGLSALGGGAASLGAKAASKLMPAIGALINQYIPENISRAGLSKIDPRFGKFIEGALNEGYSYEDLRNFLGEKIQKSQSPAIQEKNIIEQFSPELHQFLSQEIKNGLSPLQAGAKASVDKKFMEMIKKITKENKIPWSNLLESVYGSSEPAQQQIYDGMAVRSAQQAQPQQSSGIGNAELMAALQKIMQM